MDNQRILIVRLGAIGDVIHTLPALSALRHAMPSAHLTWVVERGGAAKLLRGNPSLDDLIELDLRGWRKSLTTPETLTAIRNSIHSLRAQKFDLSLDFQGLLKSAMVPWLARIPRRIGFAKQALREPASRWLLNESVAVDDNEHVIKKICDWLLIWAVTFRANLNSQLRWMQKTNNLRTNSLTIAMARWQF